MASSQAKTIHPKKPEAMMLERTTCRACGRESNASLLRRWSSQSKMNSRLGENRAPQRALQMSIGRNV